MFITFEGGEGSGKTTQIEKLSQELQNRGLQVITTREPGGTKLGEHVRDCLLNPDFGISFGPRAELMLYLASRVQNLEDMIRPAIAEGKIVLCDRFNDSSIAYQGGARDLGIDHVEQLCELACNGFGPDITFFLDIDPEVGMSRLEREHDRLEGEGLAFHKKVRESFHQIAKQHPERIHLIDAELPQEEVFSHILKAVDSVLAKR